ncbi:hypothetical protein A3765_10545 [Oleiphilus sp. HI0130]|nr:hypothetical protein A3765_10545 [Oleiphilus sp. HI0130]
MSYLEKLLVSFVAGVLIGFAVDTYGATASEVVAQFEKPDIHLTWVHANLREDGTPLSVDEIKGYNIYYAHNGGPENVISLPPTTAYSLLDATPGIYLFQISTVAEIEGRRSEIVQVEITRASPLFPEIRVTLEICNSAGECIEEGAN